MAKISAHPDSGFVYVIGEREEPVGFVKIGMTIDPGAKVGRRGLTEGNWRKLELLHRHEVPWSQLRWFEWRVHQQLWPWHKRGEWYDARHLLPDHAGDWGQLLEDAFAGRVAKGKPCVVGTDDHHLVAMRRHWPLLPITFTARCSCGWELVGDSGRAFITVLHRFEHDHLGITRSTWTGLQRSDPAVSGAPVVSRSSHARSGLFDAATRRR